MTAKQKGTEGPAPGFWLMTPSLPALEIARKVGFELVIIDAEHGSFDRAETNALTAAAVALGLTTLVRAAETRRAPIQDALDAGADGVLLPQIRDAEDAATVSGYAKYPPLGSRGFAGGRTDGYGLGAAATADAGSFPEAENDRTRCYVMIETEGALRDAARIAALDTVDGLFIGPADLSLNRGRGLPRETAEDFTEFATIAKAARASGKAWAMPAMSAGVRRFAREHGAAFVTASTDLAALGAGFLQHFQNSEEP